MKAFKTYIVLFVSVFMFSANATAEIKTGTPFGDIIYGTPGNDELYGLGGPDQLYGGAGNDYLDGGLGLLDYCDGGPGIDIAHSSCESCVDIESLSRVASEKSFDQDQTEGLIVIAGDNLNRVKGGSGLTVVFFPFTTEEAQIAVRRASEEKINIPLGTNANGMLAVIKALNLGSEAFEKVINGSLSISMTVSDIAKASSDLFTKGDKGIIMEHPLSGNEIELINVDYIGFADKVLIPVF